MIDFKELENLKLPQCSKHGTDRSVGCWTCLRVDEFNNGVDAVISYLREHKNND